METPGLAFRKFEKPKKQVQKRTINKSGKFLNLTKKTNETKKYIELLNTLKLLPDISSVAETFATEIQDIDNFVNLNAKLLAATIYYLSRYDNIKYVDDLKIDGLNSDNFNDQVIFNYLEIVGISIDGLTIEEKTDKKSDFLRYLIVVLKYRQK